MIMISNTKHGQTYVCHNECIDRLRCLYNPDLPEIEMVMVEVKPGPHSLRDDWGVRHDEDGTITLYKKDPLTAADLDDLEEMSENE